MRRTGARLFFGMLAVLAGVAILVQVVQFQGISGASVQEDGSESSEENAVLRVRELSAFQEGAIVHVRFLIESERGGAVSIAYVLEGGGIRTRSGEQPLHVEAGVPSLQRLRLAVPEAEEAQGSTLYLTLSVSDGSVFAYRRIAVREERGKEDAAYGRSALAIPLGLIGVSVLVGGYVVWYLYHRRAMYRFAHYVPHHVSVQHERALR